MQYGYRTTLVNAATGVAKNTRLVRDTEGWPELIKTSKEHGNASVFVDKMLELVHAGNLEAFAAVYLDFYIQTKHSNPIPTFELAMYLWEEYKAGRISKDAWSATLAVAWQCGTQGMAACVDDPSSTLITMFKETNRETMIRVADHDNDDLTKRWAELPETLEVYAPASSHAQ